MEYNHTKNYQIRLLTFANSITDSCRIAIYIINFPNKSRLIMQNSKNASRIFRLSFIFFYQNECFSYVRRIIEHNIMKASAKNKNTRKIRESTRRAPRILRFLSRPGIKYSGQKEKFDVPKISARNNNKCGRVISGGRA